MESTSQLSLSAEDYRVLRSFVSAHQQPLWREYCYFGLLAFLVVALLAGAQVLGRWVPSYWETRGFVLCSQHHTVSHGALYLPDGPSFTDLLRGPLAFSTLLAVYFAMAMLAFVVRELHARRVAKLVQRVLPPVPAA